MTAAVATDQFDPKAHRAFLKQLRADLGDAARKLDRSEARYLVDLYYQLQELRKASANQSRAAGEDEEPNQFVSWIKSEFFAMEGEIKRAMQAFASESVTGNWTMNLYGFGPVLAGGLLAHIDILKAPTAGHIWSFAGLNPSSTWGGREGAKKTVEEVLGPKKRGEKIAFDDVARVAIAAGRNAESLWRMTKDLDTEAEFVARTKLASTLAKRPWNAKLKVLAWKIGQCVVKFQNGDNSYYGPLYRSYKAKLIEKNLSGKFNDAAAENLAGLKDKTTVTYKANTEGRLSDGHIDSRATRWVGKLFLSHWHEVAFMEHHGTLAPKPFALAHLGHAHYIEVPYWPFPGDYQELLKARL
jgi:hypothetical protein